MNDRLTQSFEQVREHVVDVLLRSMFIHRERFFSARYLAVHADWKTCGSIDAQDVIAALDPLVEQGTLLKVENDGQFRINDVVFGLYSGLEHQAGYTINMAQEPVLRQYVSQNGQRALDLILGR